MTIIAEHKDGRMSSKKQKRKTKETIETTITPMHHSILLKSPDLGSEKLKRSKGKKRQITTDGEHEFKSRKKQKNLGDDIFLTSPKFSADEDSSSKGHLEQRITEDEKGLKGKKKRKFEKDSRSNIDASFLESGTPKIQKKKMISDQSPTSRYQKPLEKKKSAKHKDKSGIKNETSNKLADTSKKSPFKKKTFESKKRKANESLSSEPSPKKRMTEKEKMVELSKKERKLLRKTTKNNYELAMKAKKLWEVLRNHEKSKDEKKKLQLCQQLHNLIKGKVNELIYAHDTSRVIECLVAMGDANIRTALFDELKGQTLTLSKSVYAKFFVLKLLKYGTKEQRNALITSVYGNVIKLVTHSEAATVIEEMYNDYALANQRTAMVEEFYGPTFQLFKDNEVRTLDQVLAKDPSKKESILGYMKEVIMKLIDKPVVRHSLVHHVLYEYITHCADKDRSELIESLRESLVQIVHTRDGSRVAMHCIWHGTSKDRKLIIKSLKTHVAKICKEEHGHMVLLAVFDSVDDTRLVHKALLDELMQSLKEVMYDLHGRKVILYLLSPRDSAYNHPDIIKLLQQGDGNAHSKKDQDVRWQELLKAVSLQLSNALADNIKEMISSPPASIVAQAIIKHGLSGDLNIVFKKIAELVAEPFDAEAKGKCHILEDPAGHMLLKCLIKEDKRRAENNDNADLFCHHLLQTVPTSAYSKWIACNRATFILVCILETGITEITEKLKTILDPLEKRIAKKHFKGAEILLKKL